MSDAAPVLRVNGRPMPVGELPDSERLLDTLRWRLGLKGTKEGCRSGDCGACTVLVDGESTLSCLTLTAEVREREISTIEGIAAAPEGAPILRAFSEESALQCGYCTPGFVVAIAGLRRELGAQANPDRLLEELAGNLCRCTGYSAIVRAVRRLDPEGR